MLSQQSHNFHIVNELEGEMAGKRSSQVCFYGPRSSSLLSLLTAGAHKWNLQSHSQSNLTLTSF